MIKEIIKYPNPLSKEFDTPVRNYDDNLKELIQDLKDTIVHNNLDGLSAYQINNPLNVIVVKIDASLLTMINPNIYNKNHKIRSEEKTQYFGDVTATITRYKEIKVLYEDIDAKTHYLNLSDDEAILMQRKVDYTLGGTIRYRLNEQEQDQFDLKLEFASKYIKNDSCPRTFVKDKILNYTQYLTAASFIFLIFTLFLSNENDLIVSTIENYSMVLIFLMICIYFFYGMYENNKNKSCSTCQIGHLFGNSLIELIKLLVLFILNYLVF